MSRDYYKCNKCKIDKHIAEYYTHSNGKHRKQCKKCILSNNAKNSLKYGNIYHRIYFLKNKEKCLERTREWRKNNLQYDAYRSAKYRNRKNNQTPAWANMDEIKKIYLNCPKGMHVDHIVPLKGIMASGLHVSNNLQYLTPVDNLRKRNLYVG